MEKSFSESKFNDTLDLCLRKIFEKSHSENIILKGEVFQRFVGSLKLSLILEERKKKLDVFKTNENKILSSILGENLDNEKFIVSQENKLLDKKNVKFVQKQNLFRHKINLN